MSTSDQLFAGIIYLTNTVGLVEIAMVALVVRCHIHVHNVAILQRALIWYPMTDDLHNIRACICAWCT